MTNLQKKRRSAFIQQNQRCYYCSFPLWLISPEELCPFSNYKVKLSALKCTAEHLVARQDGGSNKAINIVAACQYCNSLRHRRPKPLPSENYRKHVQKRVEKGAWHSSELHKLMITLGLKSSTTEKLDLHNSSQLPSTKRRHTKQHCVQAERQHSP